MGLSENRNPMLLGVPVRTLSLVALTLQFSTVTLLLHYSRVMPTEDGHRYLPSTAVFLVELLKLVICLAIAFYQISKSSSSVTAGSIFGTICQATIAGDSWKLAVPAALYTLANSLQYLAISNLDAATYQVFYQLKILFTAAFSVTMLRRSLNPTQWMALVLLMIGVGIVSLPSEDGSSLASNHHTRVYIPGVTGLRRQLEMLGFLSSGGSLRKRSATYEGILEDELALEGDLPADTSVGLLATIGVCATSGFAGVYFEKVLKEALKPPSMWVRNIQLSLYSLFPALFIGILFVDGETVAKHGFFDGYNWVVVLSIVIQSVGGILAAFVVYYADNISKNFAISVSMILSSLASFMFFDFNLGPSFVVGTFIVILSTRLYSMQEMQDQPTLLVPEEVHEYERVTIDAPQDEFDRIISLPLTPLRAEAGLSSSRPASPNRKKRKTDSYFSQGPE